MIANSYLSGDYGMIYVCVINHRLLQEMNEGNIETC